MWAMLAAEVLELTRPMYSSMSLGLLPADWIRVGCGINVGMGVGLPALGFGLPVPDIRLHQKLLTAKVAKEGR
jgi:hypothetical protein